MLKFAKGQRGFTLVELVIVIMITGILVVIGSRILTAGYNSYLASRYLIAADAQARVALERIQRDVRAIRSPSDITTASSSQLVFVNTSGNTITYSLSGTSLKRQTNANTSQILADGIQSLTLSYFDLNGAATAILANIRYITISLNVVLNNTNFTASTSVYPRNLP